MAKDDEVPEADLETLSKEGVAPKSRISKSSSAWSILKKMIKRDEARSRKRAIIQGQIDGNRPYDSSELQRLGQSYRSNVNFRDAEGIRDSRKTSYYELLMEVETFVDIKTPGYDDKEDPDAKWGDVIAEKFTDMMVAWPGWWFHMLVHQEQMVTWGTGNMYWENEVDWRFKSARVGSFLVPDETKATLDDFDVIAIRDIYRVHDLFKYVKDEETIKKSQKAGWDTKLIIDLIRKSVTKQSYSDSYSIGEWESQQQKIKDNDLEYSYGDYENIKVAHLLVKEYDGRITHIIISEDEQVNATTDEQKNKFIFKEVGQFANWYRTVCLFLSSIGEGTYHSIRGLGAKIFAHCQISDRLKNTILDGAMASATILIQPQNEGQRERVRFVRVGPFTVMPNGYSVIPDRSHQPNLLGLVGVESLVQANLNRNVGLYRPDVVEDEKTPQSQNTAELRNRASKEAKLEKSDINIYYMQWDRLYDELFRRVLNPNYTKKDPGYEEVQEFLKACKDAGVPKELLKYDALKVKARRALGYGSPVMRSMITADILSVSPYFDERGKMNAIRDYVMARAGVSGVERYIPQVDRNQIPTTQHTLAGLETNDMREGVDVIVGVDQPHVIHLIVHVPQMVGDANAFLSGEYQGEPESLYKFLSVGIAHAGRHLDYMVDDPAHENEYQMFVAQLTELAKALKMIEGIVNQNAAAREEQARKNAELLQQAAEASDVQEMQVELAKIQKDFELKAMKEQGLQFVRERKAAHSMMIDEMLAQHQLSIQTKTGG